MIVLAAAAVLAAPPATPAPAAAPAKAGFEVILSEAVVGALLAAMMPYETVLEQEVGALGLTRTIQTNVRLSNPRTKVTAAGVKVTLDYVLDGPLSKSGTAVPTLALTPVPARKVIEGRLVRSGVMLPGGFELPLEDLVEPIEIPAVIPQAIEAGDTMVDAEARLTEVLLEEGRIRVRGDASFKPRAAAPAPATK